MSNRSCLVASHDAIWSAECGLPSKKFAAKIRGDWLIENQVHWVKDVIFNEDKSKIRELLIIYSWPESSGVRIGK